MTASIVYKGHLRCGCTHIQSGTVMETDAPTDNRGKGERFSPTDMVCVALATCVITTMALKANDTNIDLGDTSIAVSKHILTIPRRIGKIDVLLSFPHFATDRQQLPEMKSIQRNLLVDLTYKWAN